MAVVRTGFVFYLNVRVDVDKMAAPSWLRSEVHRFLALCTGKWAARVVSFRVIDPRPNVLQFL